MNLHDFCSSNIKSFPSFHDWNQIWSLWMSHKYSETDILSSIQSDKGIASWTQNYRLYKIRTAPLSERRSICYLTPHIQILTYCRAICCRAEKPNLGLPHVEICRVNPTNQIRTSERKKAGHASCKAYCGIKFKV